MKSLNFVLFYFFCFFTFFFLAAEPLKFEIKGDAAILINADSGAVLFEANSRLLHYPASTTKVATALFALKLKGEALDLPITAEKDAIASLTQEAKRKSNYTLPSYWIEPDSMHIGIKNGEVMTLQTLLEGMLIPSGNDAANVIARALAPSIPEFMQQLNRYLKEIGCQDTHFCNPHGLHDPSHQTTAYDLSLMAKEAIKYPAFQEIVKQSRFIRPKTNKQPAATLLQTNRLLRPGKYYYPKAFGIKTGWHAKANKSLIAGATHEGRVLIAVLLGYKNSHEVFEDAIALFEMAFNQPKVRKVFLKEGPQTFTKTFASSKQTLKTYLAQPVSIDYFPAEDPQVRCLLYWHSVQLPIVKDQEVGKVRLVSQEGAILQEVSLLAMEPVKKASFFWFFGDWSQEMGLLLGGVALALTLVFFKFWRTRHREPKNH